jgi:hypothetical protein
MSTNVAFVPAATRNSSGRYEKLAMSTLFGASNAPPDPARRIDAARYLTAATSWSVTGAALLPQEERTYVNTAATLAAVS